MIRRIVPAVAVAVVCVPPSFADPPGPLLPDPTYLQRGVASREAFDALFGLPTPRGQGGYMYTPETLQMAPAFRVGGTSALPFGSSAYNNALLDMSYYANSGQAGQQYFQTFGSTMRAADALGVFPDSRGYILTYRGQGAGTPYTGNLSNVALVNPDAPVWGITPVPSGFDAAGNAMWRMGDVSVLGPGHPAWRPPGTQRGNWPAGHDGTSPQYRERNPPGDMLPSSAGGWGAVGAMVVVSSYASFIEQNAQDPNVRLAAVTIGVLANPAAVPTEAVNAIARYVAKLPNDILTARTRDDFYLAYWANPELGRALWNRFEPHVRYNRGSLDDNFRAWATGVRFAAYGRRDLPVTAQDLISAGTKNPWELHPRWSEAKRLLPRPGECP